MSRRRGLRVAAVAALALLALAPASVLAHPLGNFTINHYAGLRVAPDRISLDVVIDEAEIPAFQERQRIDTDGDGTLSAEELEAERVAACPRLAADLRLTVGGAPVPLRAFEAGLSFPAGAGGLSTMRLVCELDAPLATSLAAGTAVAYEDRAFAERIGWREIVVTGDGATVSGSGLAVTSVSGRLTRYPGDLLSQPLAVRALAFSATPGGPPAAAWQVPDATALPGVAAPDGSALSAGPGAPTGTGALGSIGAVPGGIGSELSSIVNVGDLSPALLLGSLLVAIGLGAAHALSPGHGKTIMAAYLVGTRGTARQAVGLGLAVTVSHTLGVMGLAVITLLAASTLPPERLYPILGLASGGLVVAIGGSLLVRRLRALLAGGVAAGHGHEHPHESHEHPHGTHDHGHDHGHAHEHELPHPHPRAGEPAAAGVSWRSLFALGLSGGLVPSASALILLLGSIAAGRLAYGVVLVLAFGLGMALVLAGVGLLLVHASKLATRIPAAAILGRRWDAIQVGMAALVVVLGVFLTSQALTQVL